MFKRKDHEKLSEKELIRAAEKREKIINDGQAMKRLLKNPDFQRYCEILLEEREAIRRKYEDKYTYVSRENADNIALLTRINQINEVIKKPNSLIWLMEKMTEVRGAIKAKTRVRQAHGTKTGGNK